MNPAMISGSLPEPVSTTETTTTGQPLKDGRDLVVMDNLGAHEDARIKPLIEAAGARVTGLPPYSPDLNPIELAWAKVKRWLRTAKARTRERLDQALKWITDLITPDDARAWLKHCGYRYQPS